MIAITNEITETNFVQIKGEKPVPATTTYIFELEWWPGDNTMSLYAWLAANRNKLWSVSVDEDLDSMRGRAVLKTRLCDTADTIRKAFGGVQ